MADLATAMATLANISTMQLANNLSKVKLVQNHQPLRESMAAMPIVFSLPSPCGPWPKVQP